jgi:hypothetical protein
MELAEEATKGLVEKNHEIQELNAGLSASLEECEDFRKTIVKLEAEIKKAKKVKPPAEENKPPPFKIGAVKDGVTDWKESVIVAEKVPELSLDLMTGKSILNIFDIVFRATLVVKLLISSLVLYVHFPIY